MKVHKPNTDQVCEVFLSNGDKRYAEYILDPETTTRPFKPNVFESFIPVCDGEQITVNVHFKGTVLHGAADILADGAFVFDRRIEGDKSGHLKFQKRDWKIDEVYNVPAGTDAATMHTGRAIVAGNLLVKSLDADEAPLYVKGSGKLGLGSLAVIVSVNQDTEEMYSQKYRNQTMGNWRHVRANHADGGIKPVHELEFRLEDDEVHFNRQARHRRHLDQMRFGTKPWAMFVFFYRSQNAIQSAPCIRRSEGTELLDPFLGEFTFADPDAIMKKRLATRAKNEQEKMEAEHQEEDFGYDGNDTFSNTRSASASEGLFVSRSPSRSVADVPRRRLFGNSLGFESASGYGPRRDSGIPEQEIEAGLQQGAQSNGDWQDLFGDDAVEDNIAVGQPQQGGEVPAGPSDSISGAGQGDDFDFNFFPELTGEELTNEIDHTLQVSGFEAPQAPDAAPVAKMVVSSPSPNRPAPSQQSGPGDAVQSIETSHHQQYQSHPQHLRRTSTDLDEEEQAEPSPLAQLVSSAVQNKVDESKMTKAARIEAKAAKKERPPPAPKGKPVFDPTAKTGYGFGNPTMTSKQGQAPTQQAMRQLDAQDQQTQGMLQNYLQSQTGVQQQYAPSSNSPQQAAPYYRPWETAQPRQQPTQYPMSPPSRITHPTVAALSAPASPQPAQASPHTPATAPASAIPRKRSASITSRESTPASTKRARAAENAAKKATLLAQLQEKKAAKEAEERQLAEQRRARDEMERRREEEERREQEEAEAEEAEIAALQAQLDNVDAETEDVKETARREQEEARMRELERIREGEE